MYTATVTIGKGDKAKTFKMQQRIEAYTEAIAIKRAREIFMREVTIEVTEENPLFQ